MLSKKSSEQWCVMITGPSNFYSQNIFVARGQTFERLGVHQPSGARNRARKPPNWDIQIYAHISGQITIISKPELRAFWGDSLTKLPFGVTSAKVVTICPDISLN